MYKGAKSHMKLHSRIHDSFSKFKPRTIFFSQASVIILDTVESKTVDLSTFAKTTFPQKATVYKYKIFPS